jgi:hypothetical protein
MDSYRMMPVLGFPLHLLITLAPGAATDLRLPAWSPAPSGPLHSRQRLQDDAVLFPLHLLTLLAPGGAQPARGA